MKLIRNRAEARWLPGRFNLAMFRLLAFFVCRTAKQEDRPGLVLAIDRHQSAVENYAVASWLIISSSVYAFALLRRIVLTWAAVVLALPVALLVIQALTQLVLLAPRRWNRSHVRLNTFILMSVMVVLSIYTATTAHWTNVVGWVGVVLAAFNALTAVVLRFLQPRLDALERSFENES